MKFLDYRFTSCFSFFVLFMGTLTYAQEGKITINQDKEITELLELKKDINTSEINSNKFVIQIFSGNRQTAEKRKSVFESKFSGWTTKLVFQTPNYKIWVGKYRTRLEGDRALAEVQEHFPDAFIFKPKENK